MQTYKAFLKIAKKNLPSVAIYFIVFMVISIMMSSSSSEQKEMMYKDEKINFTVFNRDDSELGEALKDYLSVRNNYIELEDDIDELKVSLYYREIYYAIVIPEGFQDAVVAGEDPEFMNYKVTDTTVGYYMDMEVENYMQILKSYIAAGYDIEQALTKTAETMSESVELDLTVNATSEGISGNPISASATTDKPSHYYFYQYIPYIFLAMIITGLGPIIIVFGRKDITKRINASSQTFKGYSLQMVMGVVTFGAVVYGAFHLLAISLGYTSTMSATELTCYFILTLCFLILSLSIAFFGGFAFSKTATMGAFGNVISLGFSFLGGIFVPLEFAGETLLNIAKFTPTYWYVQANDAIIGVESFADLNVSEFAKDCGIQLLFAVAFICAGLAVLRYKREEA